MTDVAFGATSSNVGWTANPSVHTGGIGLPNGRTCADGHDYAMITALLGYVSGKGATRTTQLHLGSGSTANFTVAAASSAQSTGWRALSSNILVDGGSATFTEDSDGSAIYFARGGGGTSTDGETTFAGTLGGAYRYYLPPTAPAGSPTVTPILTDPTQALVKVAAPSDNGGSAVTGYQLQYSTSPTFASGVTTVALTTSQASAGYTVTGLVPGTTYYFRAQAKNAVTTKAGTVSVNSGTKSYTPIAGGKVWVAGAWVPSITRVWIVTGGVGAWKSAIVKVWESGAWQEGL